jgi:hypothetical protein
VQDEATMLRTAGGKARGTRRRRSPGGRGGRHGGGGRRGGGGAPEAGEDDAKEEDGAGGGGAPGGRGRSGRKPPTFRGPTVADRWHGGGRGRRRISGGHRRWRIPWGRGRGVPRKAAVGEDDDGGGGGGHDDNDGGGSGTKK